MSKMIKPYAEVLFDFVQAEKEPIQIYTALYEFKKVVEENPRYIYVLSSPRINRTQKKQALKELFPENSFLLVRKTLLHLLENRQFSILPAILTEFCVLFEEAHQIERVVATTAIPLSAERKAQLITVLEKKCEKTIFLENNVNPTCMGGLILSFRTKQYDTSLEKTFLQIRQELSRQELSRQELLFAEEREAFL